MSTGQLTTAADARAFALAGNATLTLRSTATGARYTYQVRASDDGTVHFVGVMYGSDNESEFAYMGIIRGGREYRRTAKSTIPVSDTRQIAFAWFWRAMLLDVMPAALEVWHEGRCCKCGRKLTTPASVALGIGPECGRTLHKMAKDFRAVAA